MVAGPDQTAMQPASAQLLWLNGDFRAVREAAISPLDRGFLYGDGVFETMRAQDGAVLYLREHLERLRGSLAALRMVLPLSLDDAEIIFRELLDRNGFCGSIAAARLIVTRGMAPGGPGLPFSGSPTVCLTTQSYTVPAPVSYRRGWWLHVFREGFAPPLARHKTLNYLYFAVARQAAIDTGADEALILDPAGRITETAAGSLLVRTGGKWWTPSSPYRLAGITVRKVRGLLEEGGQKVEERSAALADLLSAQTVWVTNSLMGIMPVRRIDASDIADTACEEAGRMRLLLFERGRDR